MFTLPAFEQTITAVPALTVGNALTVLVIPALVAEQPDALVTITSTTCPLVNAEVV